MKRREFFQRVSGGAAVVAVAPRLNITAPHEIVSKDNVGVVSIDRLIVMGTDNTGQRRVAEHSFAPINLCNGDSLQTTWNFHG